MSVEVSSKIYISVWKGFLEPDLLISLAVANLFLLANQRGLMSKIGAHGCQSIHKRTFYHSTKHQVSKIPVPYLAETVFLTRMHCR